MLNQEQNQEIESRPQDQGMPKFVFKAQAQYIPPKIKESEAYVERGNASTSPISN